MWLEGTTVCCQLPSGRVLYYRHATLTARNELRYMGGKKRVHTWGGALTENVVQSMSRDLLGYWTLEFEKAGILDPAMAGSELIVALDNLDRQIIQLEEQIDRKDGNLTEAKRRLEESRMSYDALLSQAQKKMQDNFYKGFIHYALSLSGITKAQDLPGPPEMKSTLYELLLSDVGASLCAEILATSAQPMMLDKFLRMTLETINEELKSPYENEPIGALSEEDHVMVDAVKKLLAQTRNALPGTLVGTLHKIDELQKLPADLVAHAIRKTFKNYSMNRLLEFALIKGSEATKEVLDEPLPKTDAEEEKGHGKGEG